MRRKLDSRRQRKDAVNGANEIGSTRATHGMARPRVVGSWGAEGSPAWAHVFEFPASPW